MDNYWIVDTDIFSLINQKILTYYTIYQNYKQGVYIYTYKGGDNMSFEFVEATKERIEEMETIAWVGFDTVFKPAPKSEIEIFHQGKGYLDPDTNSWSESATTGKPIVGYEGSPIFIRSYFITDSESTSKKLNKSYIYIYDLSYNGTQLEWNLRNAVEKINTFKIGKDKKESRQVAYHSFMHDEDTGSLKKVKAVDMFKHPLINEIKKAPMTSDCMGFIEVFQDNTINLLSIILNPEEASMNLKYHYTHEESDELIVEKFFHSDGQEYDPILLTKIFSIMEDNFIFDKKNIFSSFEGRGELALDFLSQLGYRDLLMEILNRYPFEHIGLNVGAIDIESYFGVPKVILTHAAHRECMDSLRDLDSLRKLWTLTKNTKGYYEFFEYMDKEIKKTEDDYDASELFEKVFKLIEEGNDLEEAICKLSKESDLYELKAVV